MGHFQYNTLKEKKRLNDRTILFSNPNEKLSDEIGQITFQHNDESFKGLQQRCIPHVKPK